MVARTPLLTVAICTRNRAASLAQSAGHVLGQITDDTQLLIVDNASTDDTPRVAAALTARHSNVRVVTEPRLGLSHARNTALAEASSRYVAFLDDDALADPGWLSEYRRFLESPPAPTVAAAGGVVVAHYDVPLPPWVAEGDNTLRFDAAERPMLGPGWPWGCNFVCDRAVALTVGGFCPRLGRRGTGMGAHEETDLFRRLRLAGYSVWWVPNASIRHHIDRHRLTIAFHCYAAFSAGRSTATLRLRERAGSRRKLTVVAGRLITMPIVGVAYGVLAVGAVLARQGRVAAKALATASRAWGMVWQLVINTPLILRGDV